MTRQEKNELASKEGYAFLLRGEAETRLCDYDAAMRTFQLGCKADARLGPEARKELRQAWYAAKELCRGWRRAGRLKKMEQKKKAFAAERRPVLHDIEKFSKPEDKALALKNLAVGPSLCIGPLRQPAGRRLSATSAASTAAASTACALPHVCTPASYEITCVCVWLPLPLCRRRFIRSGRCTRMLWSCSRPH